ncbi:hypothetical protein ACQY1Q_08360 [Tenacibaculum sp. TC6]|uniref:hypothetical protein n=1 Tax=Tenacibaculum sp. TC6 TaxID=3423223 RepID=UPI003D36E0FD
MLKKMLFILFWIFNITKITSQTEVANFQLDLKTNTSLILRSFSIFNDYNGKTATFIMEKKRAYIYLLNKNLEVEAKSEIENLKKRYVHIVGNLFDDKDNYTLVLSNETKSKFASIHFNLSSGKISYEEDTYNFKNHLFLQNLLFANENHLLFYDTKSSNIIARTYRIGKPCNNSIFKISKETFYANEKKEIALKELLADYSNPNFRDIKNLEYELTKISETPLITTSTPQPFPSKRMVVLPTSIELASKLNKIYISGDSAIITLDKNKFFTQILTLNLKNNSYHLQKIKKPLFKEKAMLKASNSFINDHFIFLIASSNDSLSIHIRDLKTKRIVKKFEASANDQSIDFINTSFKQKGGAFDETRTITGTHNFLRKITQSNIGISILKNSNSSQMTIGSHKQALKGISTIYLASGLSHAVSSKQGNFQISFSNLNNSFSSYFTTKSIQSQAILDKDFNYITDTIPTNVFDEITSFLMPPEINEDGVYFEKDQFSPEKTAIDVVKINNQIMLGYFIAPTKTYHFVSF